MANNYPRQPSLAERPFMVEIADISTADQRYIAPGFRGKIKAAYSCLGGSISGSDATITLKISGTAVTGGTITVAQDGSGAGDVDSTVPTAKDTFTETDHIEVETDGSSTGTHEVVVTLWLEAI